MLKMSYLALVLLVSVHNVLLGNAQRTKDKMYEPIESKMGCFRRMNATHQVGCSSKRGGSVGVVHICDTVGDLDFILKNGSAWPYIPVLPYELFNADLLNKLVTSQKVAGALVYPSNMTAEYFSHEKKCPNERYSLPGTCNADGWNPWGTGLLYADIPFPMFYIEDYSQIIKIRDCFRKFNNFSYSTQRDRSMCSLELNAFMFATTDTRTCQRRSNKVTNLNPVKLCDPLGDDSIWGSLFPLVEGPDNNTKPFNDQEYIIVSARLDTTSLFDKTAGAESPVTGIVSVLTIAKLLKQMLPSRFENVKKNVLFVFLNGESYDYIGSQRLLYDMESGSFPNDEPDNNVLPKIRPENVSLFIELSQLGMGSKTYVHYLSRTNSKVTKFINSLGSNNMASVPVVSVPDSLPPSSLHTFLTNDAIKSGLLVTNHQKEYRNHYYNSLYDNASNILYEYQNGSEILEDSIQRYVGDVAWTVAKSIYEEVTDRNYTGDAAVDYTLVDELFYCYLENASCKVHKAVQKVPKGKQVYSLYVGVDVSSNLVTSLVALTLAWFTGDVVGAGGPDCTNRTKHYAFRYYSMAESINNATPLCYKASVNTTEAVSPAFIIDDYDWSSNKYSSWSESTWQEMSVRMFLKPSSAHENMTIAVGSMTLILSFVLVYFVKTRSRVLFAPSLPAEAPADC
ncbi:nicastrin isoform X2 [Cylas formicarius]|uniref:nicastrin isoform X2 n=1 Tax=Cylas formicarius TaxID=197179 RepID=UPI0029586B22|nr:nicastrin isoform X2 [Cylas formicarius]